MRWIRAPRLSAPVSAAVALFAFAPAVWAQDSLDKLLNDIPDVPNAENPQEEEEAAPEESLEAELPAYVKAVRRAVLDQWAPKAKVVKKNPKAKSQFLVKLDIEGQRIGVSAVELSGVKSFDSSVYEAIMTASYPKPPPQILSDVERGVVVTITSRAYGK